MTDIAYPTVPDYFLKYPDLHARYVQDLLTWAQGVGSDFVLQTCLPIFARNYAEDIKAPESTTEITRYGENLVATCMRANCYDSALVLAAGHTNGIQPDIKTKNG